MLLISRSAHETLLALSCLVSEMKELNFNLPLTRVRARAVRPLMNLLLLATICAASASAAASLVNSTLPQATAGLSYNTVLSAQGGLSPYTFSSSGSSVPEGLVLSSNGTLSGTPTRAGIYTLPIQITDAAAVLTTVNASLRINSPSGLTFTSTPPSGNAGSLYDFTFAGQGGTAPYSWDIQFGGGTLPSGLTLTSAGRLSGTPTVPGVYPIVVRLTDANGSSFQSMFSLQINANTFSISTSSLAGGFSNVPYSQTISAVGGTPPYSFGLLSGTLPLGLTISSSGLISGVPSASGAFNFFLRATDNMNAAAQASFSITITGTGPRILVSSLPTGILSQPYAGSLIVQGGTAPYIFSLVSGLLPAGLTLNNNGGLSGTPATSGVFPVTVRATDAAGQTTQLDLILNINSSTFGFTSVVASDGFVNQSYSYPLTVSGGTGPFTYSLLSGNLPAGVTLGSNGALTGTATTAGTYNFVIRAVDSLGATAQVPLTVKIQASGLSIQQNGLPTAAVGQPYTSTLIPVNGVAPFSFSLVSGTLPPGITLAGNGNLSGIPTTSGIYQVTIKVTDANSNTAQSTINLLVGSTGLNITTVSLPSARVAQSYLMNLFSSGGSLPYNYAVITGTLPAGLALSSTGLLSGTPTTQGPTTFTIRVMDGNGAVSQATYTLNTNSSSSFAVSPPTLPSGQIGRAYSTTLTSSGGAGPYTYTVSSGALPLGLSLSSAGVINGTPTVAGNFPFNIQAVDSTNTSVSYSQSITISSSNLNIVTLQVSAVQQGIDYLAYIIGGGGNAPYIFTLASGNLPPGLTLNSNGTVSGLATATGTYPVSVRISDQSGNTATANFTFTVSGSGSLQISTSALPTARNGQAYNASILASGGQQPYLFSLIGGSLPAGLILASNGQISGTALTDGSSTFSVRLQDAIGATSQVTLTINVTSSTLNIAADNVSTGQAGIAYSSTLTASGGTGTGYSFVVIGGALPTGVTLSSSGVLSGTPTVSGSFPVVIRVVDSIGAFYQKAFTVSVGSTGLAFTNISLPIAYIGQQFRFNLQAAGGVAPYMFSVSNGTLPSGLTMNSNGEISGLPQTASNSPITFRVVDAMGATNTVTLAFNVTQSTLQFLFNTIPAATVGQLFTFTPTATGGTGPYTFSVVGNLPAGLTISPAGVISGVPSQEGTFNLTLRGQDALGAVVQANYGFVVSGAGFRISTATLNTIRVNQPFTQTLATAGGTGTSSFVVQSGTLPTGLTLSMAGVLSGTATTAGSYTFTIRATDGSSLNAVATYTVIVSAPIVNFANTSLVSGTIGQAYNQTISVSGGTGPYTYVISAGSLPPGLTLSSSGALVGSPTGTGTFNFTVRATDAAGNSNTADFVLGVSAFGSPNVVAIVDAANYAGNGVAPGEIVVLFGTNLGPASLLSFSVVNNGVPTALAGTRVLFDGVAASIIYTSANQVAVIVPVGVASKANVLVTVEYLGMVSAVFQVPVKAVKPALFTTDASGRGAGAILNQDNTVNTAPNPARKETVVSFYLTGAGLTSPTGVDGQIVNTVANLVNPVSVTINGQPSVVQYAGNAPSLVPGVAQINVKLPVGTKSGPNAIVLTIGTTQTVSEVTVFVE